VNGRIHLGKSVRSNSPGKKHNSGFGLLPIAVTRIKLRKTSQFSAGSQLTSVSFYFHGLQQ